jgi:hypothetical protein
MPHPFALLVWDRVFYLDTWDPTLAIQFFNSESERLDKDGTLIAPPEDATGCAARIASPAPSAAEPSGSAASNGSGEPSGSVAPSGSAAPSPSPAPSASPEPSPASS